MVGASRAILVIGDDPDLVRLCRVLLEFAGYDVRLAAGGPAGLTAARTSPPDAVVLDVMMPGGDGWPLLRELRDDPALALVPVVMLTVTTDRADQLRAWRLGADEFLTKPFAPATLTQALEDVLASSPEERALRRRRLVEGLG